MQGHHRTRKGLRPRHLPEIAQAGGDDHGHADAMPARLFLCQGCRVQVLICGHCDRGHVYCAGGCAEKARPRSRREAGRRYQKSCHGRLNHAARARRHRARQNNVTHQGSAPDRFDAFLPERRAVAARGQRLKQGTSWPRWRCHYCGRRCPEFVRRNFLQRKPRPVEPSKRTPP